MAARTLDVPRRTVTLEDGTELAADEIVVATGSHAVVPSWTTLGARVVALRTLGDAQHLGTLLRTSHRLAVVGTGFLGLEVAAAARAVGVGDVVVSGPLEPMVAAVGETVSGRIRELHEEHGVALDVGAQVVEVAGDETGATVRFADRSARADAAVVALGARPNVAWLAGSGLTIVPGVVVDARGRAAPASTRSARSARGRTGRVGAAGSTIARRPASRPGPSPPTSSAMRIPWRWCPTGGPTSTTCGSRPTASRGAAGRSAGSRATATPRRSPSRNATATSWAAWSAGTPRA